MVIFLFLLRFFSGLCHMLYKIIELGIYILALMSHGMSDHFIVRPNKWFMRHVLRQFSQSTGQQTIAHLVARLRKTTDGSKFYDSYDALVDQVVSGCYDPFHR